MKWLGFKQIAVKSIVVDAVDIKRRKVKQHVLELAQDIAEHGGEPIHAPTVRAGTNALLCGRDRFAATLVNGAKRLWVHVVDCDDDGAKALELAENIYRRADNRAELIAQLVRLKEQHLRAADDARRAAGEKVSEAPKDSPKARARKEVARAAGVSTTAVRQAENRSRKSAEEAENAASDPVTVSQDRIRSGMDAGPPDEPPALPDGFETFGLPLSRPDASVIRGTVDWMSRLAGDVNRVLSELTKLEKDGRPVSRAALQATRQLGQQFGHAIRDAVPTSLCFYCKAQPAAQLNCAPCGGTGVVGRHAGDNVPRELKAGGADAMVAVNGEFVPVASAGVSAKPAARAKKNGKPIHVEVVDEVGAAPRELTLDRSAAEESEELF